jgi:hypothetical protein
LSVSKTVWCMPNELGRICSHNILRMLRKFDCQFQYRCSLFNEHTFILVANFIFYSYKRWRFLELDIWLYDLGMWVQANRGETRVLGIFSFVHSRSLSSKRYLAWVPWLGNSYISLLLIHMSPNLRGIGLCRSQVANSLETLVENVVRNYPLNNDWLSEMTRKWLWIPNLAPNLTWN